ncbi:translation elongation factor [Acidianus sulfidivorans JP7]|uniref:Translation elongation factor n=1 Tax=Acidianus sulfidivorans JP7 TaxID=619593 RepID=A0A2U9IMC0_9CREN|nr:translation elongation factor [Acidianus sulfidivorans]AWR97135.1 translation elongation factor [Acidianus sulfidivorans JP7]
MYYGNVITVLSSDKEKSKLIAEKLGKLHENEKIQIYYRKKENYIRSVLVPRDYPEKILDAAEAVSLSSYCVFYLPTTPSWVDGEIALLISSSNCKGEIITELPEENVKKLFKGLPIENFPITQNPSDFEDREKDKGIVYIDKAFVVKGVGVVVTGFSYTQVKVHDKLKVIPNNKDVEIKSIQVLDEDQEGVEPGIRIGFSLRNVKEDEMKDTLLLIKSNIKTTNLIHGKLFTFPWSKIADKSNYHIVANGISIMGEIKIIENNTVEIKLKNEIPIAERFLLIDVNAKQGKPRVLGYITPD